MKFFNNKIFLYIVLIISFFIMFFTGIYLFLFFNFKIKGDKVVSINYNTYYDDLGVYFTYFDDILNKKVIIDSDLKQNKLGSYKITYKIKYLFLSIKKERIVNILDLENPKISLNGLDSVNICPNEEYKEEGFNAIDEIDGNLTSQVKISFMDNEIIYSVSDLMGNSTSVKRIINKIDNISPTITLNGNDIIYIRLGSNYEDEGANVSDNCDANVSLNVESNVNTNSSGTYTVNYSVTDSSGNKTSVDRKVIVYESRKNYSSGSNLGGVIYLTFDDGPSTSGTTSQILDILNKYGIKATFFVTSQFGYGDDLIKREYNEGHTVALHTSSHDYSYIYSSVDNYFSDLYAIQNRVYNLTGEKTNIMRFPGGSNNTVSNRYSYGIMSVLTSEVINRGFNYFDWNISSGDAGSCSSSSCVYSTVINNLSYTRSNVVLMHDIKWQTVGALEDIITFALSNGYTFDKITNDVYAPRFN